MKCRFISGNEVILDFLKNYFAIIEVDFFQYFEKEIIVKLVRI